MELDVEKRFIELESRMSKLESTTISSSDLKPTSEILLKLSSKFSEISPQNTVILALGITPNQTKDELIMMIEKWGSPIREWFTSSHFKQRLLKTGIVIVDNDGRCSLSIIKGSELFRKLIEKYST